MIGGRRGCGIVLATLSGEMFHMAMNEGREPKPWRVSSNHRKSELRFVITIFLSMINKRLRA